MKLSVVIPTYNRLSRLKQVIAGLERQHLAPQHFEVVVVSDGAGDGTNAYLQEVETSFRLRPVLQENAGVAVARNRGVAEAETNLILFIDDDVVPTPALLTEHLRTHEQAAGADLAVMGPMLTPPDFEMAPWVMWEQAMLVKQYEDMVNERWEPTARQFFTGNTSLARKHLIEAEGFDPEFRRAEDVELAYRLIDHGVRFVFNPEAIGLHYADRSYQSWRAVPYAYGRNDVIFAHEQGQSWLLPIVFYEYAERHPLIQYLTRICLDRRFLGGIVETVAHVAGRAGARFGFSFLTRVAYSAIFNMRYYQGVADELGGRDAFFHNVEKQPSRRTRDGKQPQKPPVPGTRRAANASD